MDLKLCPTCKTWVFADMETCFGCMYRFGSDPEREEAVKREYERSDFPEQLLDGKGEGVLEDKVAIPWPPPAEPNPEGTGDDSSSVSFAEYRHRSKGTLTDEGATTSFQLPSMTVSVRTDGPLPDGVSLSLNIKPPSNPTSCCVSK